MPKGYDQRIIAFIDILAFKDLIKIFDRDDILKMLKALEHTQNYLYTARNKTHPTQKSETPLGQTITAFSDSIVISYPTDKNGVFQALLSDLYIFQKKLLSLGFAFRGAIDIGDLYHDGQTIFGPALVNAYELESKVSIYPRIIISKQAYEWGIKNPSEDPAEDDDTYGMPYSMHVLDECINEDFDGCHFLDVFNITSGLDEATDEEGFKLLDLIHENIKKNVDSTTAQGELGKLSKWKWLQKKWSDVYK
jgi:hypothetical protein